MSRLDANENLRVKGLNMIRFKKFRRNEESSLPDMRVPSMARKYGVITNLIFRWRKFANNRGRVSIQVDGTVIKVTKQKRRRSGLWT